MPWGKASRAGPKLIRFCYLNAKCAGYSEHSRCRNRIKRLSEAGKRKDVEDILLCLPNWYQPNVMKG